MDISWNGHSESLELLLGYLFQPMELIVVEVFSQLGIFLFVFCRFWLRRQSKWLMLLGQWNQLPPGSIDVSFLHLFRRQLKLVIIFHQLLHTFYYKDLWYLCSISLHLRHLTSTSLQFLSLSFHGPHLVGSPLWQGLDVSHSIVSWFPAMSYYKFKKESV